MDFPDLFPELDQKETQFPDLFPELDNQQKTPVTNTTGMGWPAGGKYTAEQMNALDTGRASTLNDELATAKASGDTETQQQLDRELSIFNKKTAGQFTNVKGSVTPVSSATPDQPQSTTGQLPDLFPELSTPATPNFVMNRITRGILGLPTTAMEVAAGTGKLLGEAVGVDGAGDSISKAAKFVDTFAKRSWGITEEQDKNATFGQNLLGAGVQLVSTLPYLAFGPVVGTVGMAANPAIETGKSLVDAGVDPAKARNIAMTVGGAYGLLMKVGTSFSAKEGDLVTDVIKKYIASSAATGGFNSAQGAVERYSISRWLEDSNPEVSSLFKWNDLEALGIDFTLGALLGPAAKYFEDTNKSAMAIFNDVKKNRELHASMTKELMDMVRSGIEYYSSDTSKRDNWNYRFDLLSDADAKAMFDGIQKQFTFKPTTYQADTRNPNRKSFINLDNYLFGIKYSDEYKDLDNAELTASLRALTRIGNQLGFNNIKVFIMEHPGTNYSGVYSYTRSAKHSSGDEIFLPKLTGRSSFETVVHEVAHAITSNMIDAFESGNYPPEWSRLYAKYETIRSNYDTYRNLALTKLVTEKLSQTEQDYLKAVIGDGTVGPIKINDPMTADLIYKELRNKLPDDLYGLANVHEGIATIFETIDPSRHLSQNRRGWDAAQDISSNMKEGGSPIFLGSKSREPLISELWTGVWKELGKLSSDITDSPFLKTMYADMFNFAEDIPNYYIDRKYLKNVAQLLSVEEMHKYISIASILDQSSSDKERIEKLLTLSDDAEWRIMLKERPELILENTAKFKAQAEIYLEELKQRHPEAGLTRKLDKGGELYFPYKDLDQFMKDRELELLNAWDFDRPLKEKVFGPDQLKFMDKKNPLTKLLNFVFKLQRDYEGMQARMFYDIMSHAVLYKKLSVNDQKQMMSFASLVDSDPKLRKDMADQGKYWMDKVEIDEYINTHSGAPKLSEQARWAYWDIGNAVTRTWDLIDSIRAKQGLHPVERLPNYMPHMWKGAYKVFVQQKYQKKDGSIGYKTLALRGFNFKQEAQAYANKMRAQGFEIKPNDTPKYKGKDWHVVEMHDFENGIIPSIMQNLEAYRNFTLLDPNGQAHLVEADASSIVGFMSHDLAQTGVHGYVNDAMPKGYDLRDIVFGKRYRDTVDTLNLFESYVKNVTDHWKNVMYVHDVHKKLIGSPYDPVTDSSKYYGNTMARFRNFQKFMDMQVRNYTGEAVNAFKTFDQALINGSVALGIPPYFYRQAIKQVRNLMSIVFTRYNPGNWAFNYIQPLQTFSILSFVDSRRRLNGLSHANLNEIISEVKNAFNNGNTELGRALDWARQNHILDAQAEFQVRSKEAKTKLGRLFQKVNLSEVPTKIEADARETSFALSFMYWKKVLGDPVMAAEAAVETMGSSMVNYDRSKRPLMYQSYGVVGEMLSPFAVYRNAYFGNMAMMFKHALQNPKEFHAWKPFLVSNALFMFTAGMVGSIGFSEYDSIVRLLKKFAPETFGDMKESSAALIALGIPEPIRLGAITSLTRAIPGMPEGAYVSGSGAIVGVDDMLDPNIVPFITSMAGLFEITAKKAVGMSVTNEDIYGALTGIIPGQLKYPLERAFQEKDVSTSFAAKKLTGSTRRTFGDETAQIVMGKKSIKETEEKALIRQVKAMEENQKKAVKKLVELATDDLMGGTSQNLDDYYSRAQDLGISSEEFSKKIFDKRLERILPALDKTLQGNDNPMLADKISDYIRKFHKGRGDVND